MTTSLVRNALVLGLLTAIGPFAIDMYLPALPSIGAIERFKNKKVRAFTVSFASPRNLEALDDAGIASAKGARLLAEAFKGMDVTITVSAGQKRKKLLNYIGIKREIDSLLEYDSDVDKLEVMLRGDEERAIDFLNEHLKVAEELTLADDSIPKNYHTRRDYLKSEFNKHLSYLNAMFGNKDGHAS